EELGASRADRAGAAGDDRDLPRERLLGDAAELGLLERPIFHLEKLAFGQRFEAADGFRIGDGQHRVLGDVGSDRRVFLAAAHAEKPDARHQRDAWQWIERALARLAAFVIALEI